MEAAEDREDWELMHRWIAEFVAQAEDREELEETQLDGAAWGSQAVARPRRRAEQLILRELLKEQVPSAGRLRAQLSELLDALGELAGAELATFYVVEDRRAVFADCALPRRCWSGREAGLRGALAEAVARLRGRVHEGGIVMEALTRGVSLRSPDLDLFAVGVRFLPRLANWSASQALTVPLIWLGESYGVLQLVTRRGSEHRLWSRQREVEQLAYDLSRLLAWLSNPGLEQVSFERSRDIARLCGCAHLEPEDLVRDEALIAEVGAEAVARWRILPLRRWGSRLKVAMADPRDLVRRASFQGQTGCLIDEVAVADEAALSGLLTQRQGRREPSWEERRRLLRRRFLEGRRAAELGVSEASLREWLSELLRDPGDGSA